MSAKKAFWLSYDLGIKGDYTGVYTFLDSVDAKECGDSIAFFQKDYGDDFLDKLEKELERYLKIAKTDRIYVIYVENSTNKAKGKFYLEAEKELCGKVTRQKDRQRRKIIKHGQNSLN